MNTHQRPLLVVFSILLGFPMLLWGQDSPGRLPIEKAMRDFQARHELIHGRKVAWPGCFGCGGKTEAPAYPKNGYYGQDLTKAQQVMLVQALVQEFWACNDGPNRDEPVLFTQFLNLGDEGLEGKDWDADDIPRYKVTDKGWERIDSQSVSQNT